MSDSKFIRNVLILITGALLSQGIRLALAPFITRLYGAEAFGQLGAFVALTSIITSISAMSFPLAIVLPEEDSEARYLALLSILVSIAIVSVLTILIATSGDLIIAYFDLYTIAEFVWLIPVVTFIETIRQVLLQWLIRKKEFKKTARVSAIQALWLGFSKIGIGSYFPSGLTLVFMNALGSIVYVVLLAFSGWQSLNVRWITIPKRLIFANLKKLALKYYDFPLYRSPQIFINAISQGLPVLMLTAFYGSASAGFYSLCLTVMMIPISFISNSMGNVFYPRIAEASHKNENLKMLIVKATALLFVIGVLPFLVVVVYGPWLFAVVFGSEWIIAGEYARWIAILSFFQFINRPAITSIPVLKIQKELLMFEIISSFLKISALYVGFKYFKNDIDSIMLFSVVGSFTYIYLITWVIRKSSRKLVNLEKTE